MKPDRLHVLILLGRDAETNAEREERRDVDVSDLLTGHFGLDLADFGLNIGTGLDPYRYRGGNGDIDCANRVAGRARSKNGQASARTRFSSSPPCCFEQCGGLWASPAADGLLAQDISPRRSPPGRRDARRVLKTASCSGSPGRSLPSPDEGADRGSSTGPASIPVVSLKRFFSWPATRSNSFSPAGREMVTWRRCREAPGDRHAVADDESLCCAVDGVQRLGGIGADGSSQENSAEPGSAHPGHEEPGSTVRGP